MAAPKDSADEAAAEQEAAAAESLLAQGDIGSALDKLREAVALNPDNDTARFECIRALITNGDLDEARGLYAAVATRVVPDPRFAACGHWLAAFDQARRGRPQTELEAALNANKRDFEARYELAQLHFAAQRYTAAMDELLEILMRDKGWRDQLARKTFVAVLEIMTRGAPHPRDPAPTKSTLELAGGTPVVASDPVLDAYRRKLSMTLF